MLALEITHHLLGDKLVGARLVHQMQQLRDGIVQQRLVTVILGQTFQHHRRRLRQIDLIDRFMNGATHKRLNTLVIGQIEETAHDLQQIAAQPCRVLRAAQPVGNHLRRIVTTYQRQQRGGVKEFVLHKQREVISDAVLIARDDGGMTPNQRDRHAAEQRADRKPVGQSADHRRFRNGLQRTDPMIIRKPQRVKHGADKDPCRAA